MTQQAGGLITVRLDVAPEHDAEFNDWYTLEHVPQLTALPGFARTRRYFCDKADIRYLAWYETADQDVEAAKDFQHIVANPTPWSQRIMPRLRNFVRGGGRVVASAGLGQGGVLAALPLDTVPEGEGTGLCRDLAATDRISAARLLSTDLAQTSIQTREKGLRRADDSFAGLLLIEGLDEISVRNALWRLRSLAPEIEARPVEELPLYALRFNLDRRLLPSS